MILQIIINNVIFYFLVFRMAIRTYEASYKKYFPDTYEKIGKDSTHDEVRQLYDEWAVKYDEVRTAY